MYRNVYVQNVYAQNVYVQNVYVEVAGRRTLPPGNFLFIRKNRNGQNT
jgi:hypothetical protein